MTNGTLVNAPCTISKIVLGVDDSPENLFLLKAVVKAGGYTFLGANSGLECLSIVQRVTPRLILLDIQMLAMDGFRTCREIRKNPELRGVPIAFLTASKSPDDVKQGLAAGGNDFIVKPFDPLKLLERIKHWTGRTIRT